MTALVTGASGFLGRHLVAHLRAQGVRVRAFVRPGSGPAVQADERCEGDLRDPPALERAVQGVDWVFHAGARVRTEGSWEEFEATNVRATADLIACARRAGVRRVVHVSSLSVYAVPHDGACITEDDSYDREGAERGLYARSKLAADRAALQAMRTGAPVVVVRPGLLYGPGRPPPLARRAVALGPVRIVLARPGYLLPLAYVENVVDALCLAARVDAAVGRAYTIVDEHVAQADYLRLYRRVAGQRWVVIYLPVGLLRLGAGVIEGLARRCGRRPPLTRHQVERTVWSATFSVRRAEQELGWRPRVPLSEALGRALAATGGRRDEQTGAAARSAA